ARVILRGRDPLYLNAKTHLAAFRELLNVSQLEIKTEGDGVVPVQVVRASGEKCERCWHWETDVGTHPEHPTLCGRCVAAVEALRPNSPAPPRA
ncbi:MAG: hypothetical protein N2438_11720, partial [Limisphaera sp.]|nr:hypothetical protein [Limisphaera sp.]